VAVVAAAERDEILAARELWIVSLGRERWESNKRRGQECKMNCYP
jgi:hypothetical protein